jgi:hypothetical protein
VIAESVAISDRIAICVISGHACDVSDVVGAPDQDHACERGDVEGRL